MTRISSKLLRLIKENQRFLIVTHLNPEGDAIGSSLGLAMGLKKMGKAVYLLDRDPVPETLRFLPASELFRRKPPDDTPDVLILIDCNTIERTGFTSLKAGDTIIIDHHGPEQEVSRAVRSGKISGALISTTASATGELVYRLLLTLGVPIDKDIATNLYASIMVDTGGFKYSNTTSRSLRIASKLVEAGAEPWRIAREVYENIPYRAMRLLSLSFSTLQKKDGVAYITVTRDMFKRTGTTAQDTENFVEYARWISGVEVALLFREEDGGIIKVSLRSKGRIDVSEIARAFGGGGHAPAAGCRIKGTLESVRKRVLRLVSDAIRADRSGN
jgi:phosphoesterase RecJ-like protein